MCNRKSRDMHRNIELKVKFEANTHKCSFVMARIGQPLRWMNENRKLPFDLGEEVKRLSLWTWDYNYSDVRAMSILTRDLLCVHVECKFSKCKSFSRFFHSPPCPRPVPHPIWISTTPSPSRIHTTHVNWTF